MDPHTTLPFFPFPHSIGSGWLLGPSVLMGSLVVMLAWLFRIRLSLGSSPAAVSTKRQSVAVVLCLRGRDPYLEKCLEGIFSQDYPNYEVHVVIDDPWDELSDLVEQAARRSPRGMRPNIHRLTWRLTTCSLKCNALLQAREAVDRSAEVIAFIDADVVAHPSWLRELVDPLRAATIGGTTGQRWFAPTGIDLGSWLRYHWNVGATMLSVRQGLAWGGSFALRADVVRSSEVRELWSTSLVEDTSVSTILRDRGFQLVVVPEVIMVNREACGILQFVSWAQRQTMAARLYNRFPNYPNMALTAIYHGAFVMAIASLCFSACRGQGLTCLSIGMALLIFESCKGVSILIAESSVRQSLRKSGRAILSPSITTVISSMMLLPITSALSVLIWCMACMRRSVEWRGALYRVDGPQQIQLIKDRGITRHKHPMGSL